MASKNHLVAHCQHYSRAALRNSATAALGPPLPEIPVNPSVARLVSDNQRYHG
jgi:hypothetical protein